MPLGTAGDLQQWELASDRGGCLTPGVLPVHTVWNFPVPPGLFFDDINSSVPTRIFGVMCFQFCKCGRFLEDP